MDVLQLLKAEIRDRKAELSAIAASPAKKESFLALKKSFVTHVAWEAEYLLPELSHILSETDPLLEKYLQSLKRTKESLAALELSAADLTHAFTAHAEIVEEKLLPLMRQKIPTVDREELYYVFADAKQEMLATSAPAYVM